MTYLLKFIGYDWSSHTVKLLVKVSNICCSSFMGIMKTCSRQVNVCCVCKDLWLAVSLHKCIYHLVYKKEDTMLFYPRP